MLILQFPDGQRFQGGDVISWVAVSATLQLTLNFFVYASGQTFNQMYVYTAANSDVAKAMIAQIDNVMVAQPFLNFQVLNAVGLAVFTVSPNSTAANAGATITLTGQNFQTGATVTVGGTVYPGTFINAGSISFAYDGLLAATVYDVLATNPDGTTFTFKQSLTLT